MLMISVGGSYRVNCMGGANDCQVSSLKKQLLLRALELKWTQQLYAAPFLHSDDSYCGSECQGRSSSWTENGVGSLFIDV